MSDYIQTVDFPEVYFPDKIEFQESSIDKKNYSAKRLNRNFLMPAEPCAMLLWGPRGSGKTTCELEASDLFDYDTLSVFSSTIGQDKFQEMMKNFENYARKLPECEQSGFLDRIMFEDDLSCITDGGFIHSRNPALHHLVLVDDFAVSDKIKTGAFSQLILNGRPVNVSSMISTQSLRIIPKPVRDNITHFLLFKGITPYDIKGFARDYIGDMKPSEFLAMYNYAMNFKDAGARPFLMFDKMAVKPALRYRINFDFLLDRTTS